jgi:acetoacetate decarboxylase
MGFVKTREEVARTQAVLKQARFVAAEMLQINFLTKPEIVASLLPPGFEPAAEPLVSAMVGRWRSNCVGDYCGGALYLSTRYQGIEAPYVLAMYMDAEPALMYGREILGEPKKKATSNLYRRGNAMHGYIDRNGVRLVDIRATLDKDLGPGTASGANFNIKATPAADGMACETDAVVTLAEFNNNLTKRLEGTGTLELKSGAHDPCGDLPIVELRGASYVEGDLIASAKAIGTIDRHAFFPYLLGRMDDWTLLDTENDISIS